MQRSQPQAKIDQPVSYHKQSDSINWAELWQSSPEKVRVADDLAFIRRRSPEIWCWFRYVRMESAFVYGTNKVNHKETVHLYQETHDLCFR
nr:CFF_HP1_G0024720.mRNA.1.CDS.1 [Saccharomyces cerevisiae]